METSSRGLSYVPADGTIGVGYITSLMQQISDGDIENSSIDLSNDNIKEQTLYKLLTSIIEGRNNKTTIDGIYIIEVGGHFIMLNLQRQDDNVIYKVFDSLSHTLSGPTRLNLVLKVLKNIFEADKVFKSDKDYIKLQQGIDINAGDTDNCGLLCLFAQLLEIQPNTNIEELAPNSGEYHKINSILNSIRGKDVASIDMGMISNQLLQNFIQHASSHPHSVVEIVIEDVASNMKIEGEVSSRSIANSNVMYTKLIVNLNGKEIVFHSHELVKVAREILDHLEDEVYIDKFFGFDKEGIIHKDDTCFVPDPKFTHFLMQYCVDNNLLHFAVGPVPILGLESISSWYSAAQTLKKLYSTPSSDTYTGRWISVGGRMLLMKTVNDRSFNEGHFYISDHGNYQDLLSNTQEVALTSRKFDWVGFPKILALIKEFSGESDESIDNALYEIMLTVAQKHWNISSEEMRYVKVLLSRFLELKQKSQQLNNLYKIREQKYIELAIELQQEYENFFNLIRTQPHETRAFPEASEEMRVLKGVLEGFIEFSKDKGYVLEIYTDDYIEYIKKRVVIEITQDINYGDRLGVLRPVNSFGELSAEPYRKFAISLSSYFNHDNIHSAAKIAYFIRCILSGGEIREEKLNFLPNLVAAWFLGESVRNSVSILSGLMLLDLIESEISLLDSKSRNLYDWSHTLIHPDKPHNSIDYVAFRDLYGDEVDLGKFDGSHPMAHGDSVQHSKATLGKGQKLSAVRQKEGSIIIHWLSVILKQKFKLECKAESACDFPLIYEKGREPNYDTIEKLLRSSAEPSKSIKKNLVQLEKWKLLHQFIVPSFKQRLSNFDNLLDCKEPSEEDETIDNSWFSRDQISVIGHALNNDERIIFIPTINPYLAPISEGSLESFVRTRYSTFDNSFNTRLVTGIININPTFINHNGEKTHWVLYFDIRGDDSVEGVLLNPRGRVLKLRGGSYYDIMDILAERIKIAYSEQGLKHICISHKNLDFHSASSNCDVWVLRFLEQINKLLPPNVEQDVSISDVLSAIQETTLNINDVRTGYRQIYEASVHSQNTVPTDGHDAIIEEEKEPDIPAPMPSTSPSTAPSLSPTTYSISLQQSVVINEQENTLSTQDEQTLETITKIEAIIGKEALDEITGWHQYISKALSNNPLSSSATKVIKIIGSLINNLEEWLNFSSLYEGKDIENQVTIIITQLEHWMDFVSSGITYIGLPPRYPDFDPDYDFGGGGSSGGNDNSHSDQSSGNLFLPFAGNTTTIQDFSS